jgi:hypothetical protein
MDKREEYVRRKFASEHYFNNADIEAWLEGQRNATQPDDPVWAWAFGSSGYLSDYFMEYASRREHELYYTYARSGTHSCTPAFEALLLHAVGWVGGGVDDETKYWATRLLETRYSDASPCVMAAIYATWADDSHGDNDAKANARAFLCDAFAEKIAEACKMAEKEFDDLNSHQNP